MMVYFNYPNSQITIHEDSSCAHIQKRGTLTQRDISINRGSISKALRSIEEELQFGSTAGANDVWINIDFNDVAFEQAIVKHIHRILGKKYKPIRDAIIHEHCGV